MGGLFKSLGKFIGGMNPAGLLGIGGSILGSIFGGNRKPKPYELAMAPEVKAAYLQALARAKGRAGMPTSSQQIGQDLQGFLGNSYFTG